MSIVPETPPVAEQRRAPALELWAGAECTVNRVGEAYFDQMDRTGHAARVADMDRLAALGARRVRFPVLWERTAPRALADADFEWSDVRLRRLAALGIEPIVGLVHHGSGPQHTNLCKPDFAAGLAAFAQCVAARYPSINAYTPVNEPLTTARFSGLYGLWYPHERRLEAFVAALMNEVLATRMAMAAVRRINPAARLYQTEDLGQIFSSPELAEQRGYENHRRWLSLDLLFGRVGRQHPLRRELEEHGADPRLLDEWADQPCPPDLIGVNYYVTSDRFLDVRVQRYPLQQRGGNGRQEYCDLEAVRVRPEGIAGHQAVLQEAWARYGAPVALTEVHLASHREDQLRWLMEAWQGALSARATGADVRAVTVWSAFGALGWNNLVTRASGDYEPGAYDVRAPQPRATALTTLSQTLAGGDVALGLARGDGWWRRSSRLLNAEVEAGDQAQERPCVIVVGGGQFARRVAELCAPRFACVCAPTCAAAQALLQSEARAKPTQQESPWALLLAFDPTRTAPQLGQDFAAQWRALAGSCRARLRLLALSCERVFDGWRARPYVEPDRPNCRDEAGASWRALERAVLQSEPNALIVRSGFAMDPQLPADALAGALEAIRLHSAPALSSRVIITPSYLPHFVDAALDLLVDAETGIWHLASSTPCSPLELARSCAECLELPFHSRPLTSPSLDRRGPMRALASHRGWPLPDLAAAVEGYAQAFRSFRPVQPAWRAIPIR